MVRSFNYVNNVGYNKIIHIDDNKNEKGEYYTEIWTGQTDEMATTGMFCGSKYMSKEKLNEFLKYYHIDYQF